MQIEKGKILIVMWYYIYKTCQIIQQLILMLSYNEGTGLSQCDKLAKRFIKDARHETFCTRTGNGRSSWMFTYITWFCHDKFTFYENTLHCGDEILLVWVNKYER